MVDAHRHDEFSTFDGFGKAVDLAELAKQLGHTSFSLTNHGNTNGLVKHYAACQKAGIRCIMGVEAYFQPTINRDKERYHLCLYAKNPKGYENINRLMYRGECQKYYNPIITFDDLEEFSEGVICSSACVQGFVSKMLWTKKRKIAEKAAARFKAIFGDDFYFEIQPYDIDDLGTQCDINTQLMEIAAEQKIKCILTSDSHYGAKDDFDTYLKMHEIAKHSYDIRKTYGERYMPTEAEIVNRFVKMHGSKKQAAIMMQNLEEFEEKFEQDILSQLEEELPCFSKDGVDSYKVMLNAVKDGLEKIGKRNDKKYLDRVKEELRVIKMHGFVDYFLIVADYVQFARDNGIVVGPGRGSVCNCEVAYLLGITEVDSLRYDLDFRRFLRDDKKKLPDIDLDFETARRQEVIDYLVTKYNGHSAQVCSYGLYKVDNLINDLSKVCEVNDKAESARLKTYLRQNIDDAYHFTYKPKDPDAKHFNNNYDNIVKHFNKLYNQVRFIGTHAAGVAITGADIKKYCAVKRTAEGREYTVYDLADLEQIKVVKFDMLGLKTMESIGELRKLTGEAGLRDEMYEDEKIWKAFAAGDTTGVFQFEQGTPRKILQNVECDCFEDMIAVSSMNRPGPLSMKMPEVYAYNKFHQEESKKNNRYYEYTKETYGTIVYQEQLQQICVRAGKLDWKDADRLMKLMKNTIATTGDFDEVELERKEMAERFVKGAMENGWSEKDARETFKGMMAYVFNKGHSVSYGMISLEEMFYKVYYPIEFWYVKMKYAGDDEGKFEKFKEAACVSGAVLFLPHVNYSADYSIRKVQGDPAIQMGYNRIRNVGPKAALSIEAERLKNGPFKSYDDFCDRCKNRSVTSRVISSLLEDGALEFDKKTYLKRTTLYNGTLYMKGLRNGGK